MEYSQCLAELDEVLNYLSEDDLEKIPQEIKNSIKEQKDKNYIWKYDETKELREQKLNRKTIAMLSYLNMEYLLNTEQRELMEKIHRENERKVEEEKRKKYSTENLFKKQNTEEVSNQTALIEIKQEEKWYKKIIGFIRNLFKK